MSWIFSERFGVHTSFSARISPPELSRFSSQVMAQAARTPPPGILLQKNATRKFETSRNFKTFRDQKRSLKRDEESIRPYPRTNLMISPG